jgi:type IV pilus assembly protein PilF
MTRGRIGWRLAVVLAAGLALGGLSGCGKFGTRNSSNLGPDAPESPADVYVALAGEYYARGQMEVAQQRANQALNEDSNNPKAHMIGALIYQRLGETGKAEEEFKRATDLAPKDGDIRNALGTFYCAQKRYPEAEEQFKQAVAIPLYTTPWVALTNAGICAKGAGDRAKAKAYYRQALAGNPSFGPAVLESVDLDLAQGDGRSASALLTEYFKTSPPTPQALALGIRVERELGNKKAAASYAAMLKQRYPNSQEARSL